MKFFTILFSYLCIQTLTAQNSISGTVLNSKTQKGIPYVNILLKNNSETYNVFTDENGLFRFDNLSSNKYQLSIEALGYKNWRQTITIQENQNNVNIGKINLEEKIEQLESLILRAETTSIEQKVDRVVVNIGKDLTSVGTDAASVLDNVQSVTVDQQTGELSLRGNSNVRVLIDGKPSNIPTDQLIQQLPANAIKSVEIITNPSAKYSPEGNSGILNLVLVKNSQRGFHGGINGAITYGRNLRGNVGTNINYKVNHVNFYANYSHNKGKNDILGNIDRTTSQQESYGLNDRNNHFLKFGTDIELDKQTTLSFFTIQTLNDLDYTNDVIVTDLDTNTQINNTLFALNRKNNSQTYDLSFYQNYDKDEKHTLHLGISLNNANTPETSIWSDDIDLTDARFNFTEDISATSKRWLVNLDYTQPLSENIFFEAGIDIRLWNNQNSNLSTQLVLNQNAIETERGLTAFTFKRDIYASYLNYQQKINNLTIQAGLRTEFYDLQALFQTDVDNQNEEISDRVPSLYPSLFSTYQFNKKDQLKFSYSRRVDRPRIRQLTPIRRWGTPLIISVGNPDLTQQFTHSFELGYHRKISIGSASITSFYRRINNFISRTLTQDTQIEDRLILSFGNFDTTDNYGVEMASYLKLNKWWNFNGSVDLYYQNQQGIINQELTTVDNVLFNFRLNNKFTLSHKWNIQLSQMYRGEDVNVQRVREPMFMANIATSYKVLKDKGTLTLGFNDIFNTFRARFNVTNPIQQRGEFNWESQNLTFGFNYNFGNTFKQKKKPRRPSHSQGGEALF